tara:strand:- start:5694 stop:5888 length:195 start_codon:yes stop_codon:yes gene_type:complete
MKLYQIYYINSYGEKEFVAITDNPNEWLKENNEQRIGDGNEPEDLDDFEIYEEQDVWIYNKEEA